MLRALLLAFWLFAGAAQAAPVFCVDDWCLSQTAFDLLLKNAQQQQPDMTAAAYKQELVEVRLLAGYARQQHFQVEADHFGVGFRPEVKLEREVHGLFHSQLSKNFNTYAKANLDKTGLNAFLKAPLHVTGVDIDSALKPDNRKRIGMTPAQLAAAEKIRLARVQFPGDKEKVFTLAELYQQQNVQGRLALQQQPDSIAQQTRNWVQRQYFYWWLAHHSGLQANDISKVREALADRQLSNAWLEQQGLVEVMHDHANSRLEAAAKQVSDKQIADWYRQHKDSFRITNSVQAAHLACATEAACKAGRQALVQGDKLDEVIKRYADPAHQKSAQLGQLTRKKDGMHWLTSLALLQQPGDYSRPVRAPDGHWEVVWISDKQTGYLPPDSSSVRYQASRAIAKAELLAEHQTLMQQLHKQHKVVMK